MSPRLLLTLALWASFSPGRPETALSQLRVRCCASRYPLAVDCSWMQLPAPNSTLEATTFIASYRLGVGAQQPSQPCLQPSPAAARCSIPHVHLFAAAPHVLNVTALNARGASSSFLAFVAERIIQPDPPEAVVLSRIPGQRLQVRWRPPRSWPYPEIFSLKYRIRYRQHGASRFRQVGPIEATTFTLRALRPHARYHIQVSAQDLTNYGEPSNWSLPAVTLDV